MIWFCKICMRGEQKVWWTFKCPSQKKLHRSENIGVFALSLEIEFFIIWNGFLDSTSAVRPTQMLFDFNWISAILNLIFLLSLPTMHSVSNHDNPCIYSQKLKQHNALSHPRNLSASLVPLQNVLATNPHEYFPEVSGKSVAQQLTMPCTLSSCAWLHL